MDMKLTPSRLLWVSMDELVRIAAAVDDIPTLAEVDKMIRALGARPKCKANEDLINSLLELRSGLTQAA